MAETFSFELKLVDSVSASAKKAADNLRGVEKQAEKAGHALDFSKELERAEQQMKRLSMDPKGYQKLIHAQKELGEQRKKLGKESFTDAFKEKMGFGKMVTASFFGDLLAEGMIEAIKKPIEMFAEGIKEAFKAGAEQEKLNLSYRLMFGKEGKEKLEDQERFAKNTRFTGSEIGKIMMPLYNSGMGDKAARQAFSTAADLEARTGRPIQEFVEMLAKINLKGGITEKMLMSLGFKSQDFYKALAKSEHITAEEAKKRAESGKIDPQALINQLTRTVNAAQGGAAGTGGKMLSQTMGARWDKLMKLPEEYFEKISESPEWTKLSDRLGDLLGRLSPDSPDGKKIIASLMNAFEKLAKVVEDALKPESIEGFIAGIQKVADAVGVIVDGLKVAVNLLSGEYGRRLGDAIYSKIGGDEGDKKLRDIAYKQKELKVGTFSDIEKKQREKEIESMVGALTPSEKVDYANITGQAAPSFGAASPPMVSSNSKKSVNIAPTINVTVNGSHSGDPADTGKIIADHVKDSVTRHMEIAAAHGGA